MVSKSQFFKIIQLQDPRFKRRKSQDLPVSMSVSQGFSAFIRPSRNIPVGGPVNFEMPLGVNVWVRHKQIRRPIQGVLSPRAWCVPGINPRITCLLKNECFQLIKALTIGDHWVTIGCVWLPLENHQRYLELVTIAKVSII